MTSINQICESMYGLQEMSEDRRSAIKKAIMDYVLMDQSEQERLGVPIPTKVSLVYTAVISNAWHNSRVLIKYNQLGTVSYKLWVYSYSLLDHIQLSRPLLSLNCWDGHVLKLQYHFIPIISHFAELCININKKYVIHCSVWNSEKGSNSES